MCLYFTRIMSKTEAMLAALRRENNRYLAAIANVSAVVGELAGAVKALQRQMGGCNVAATQALHAAAVVTLPQSSAGLCGCWLA